VDNQARGRSGRQGDEGSSIFYVSLEDDLMRIFGSESMNNILQKLGLKDGESIDHPWINKALERAQQKVEARNFDIRKTLIKFDNVLNDQRYVIFSQREDAMNSDQIFNYSNNFLNEIIDDLIRLKIQKKSNPGSSEFDNKVKSILGKNLIDSDLKDLNSGDDDKLKEILNNKFQKSRQERIELLGEDQSKEIEKRIFLQTIDLNWKSHIQYLEQLRQVIGLRSYGQRDPLVEYKKEAFFLFENLLNRLKIDFITVLMNLKLVQNTEEKLSNAKQEKIISKPFDKKISRNEPCPCGSGKKYKRCCGAL
jgi:preprotein translocase subunit SecA